MGPVKVSHDIMVRPVPVVEPEQTHSKMLPPKETSQNPKPRVRKGSEARTIPSFKQEDLKLPKKFAEKVLELELELNHGQINVK